MHNKPSWFIHLEGEGRKGVGECSVIPGLSCDFIDVIHYEKSLDQLKKILLSVNLGDFVIDRKKILFPKVLKLFLFDKPSIQFGLEMALFQMFSGIENCFFENDFFHGNSKIRINGLVWMGSIDQMFTECKTKISQGFTTIKFKIGALNYKDEINLLEQIRSMYNENRLELRVDANGAFSSEEVDSKLEALSPLKIHSIEQPLSPNNRLKLRLLCNTTKVPIALDEELIGIHQIQAKENLIKEISPHYIVLKPSLHGGFSGTLEWIELANKYKVGWWITSALESALGLEAIAQFTASLNTSSVHGLGLGNIYKNNEASSLRVENGCLFRRV